MRKTERQIVEQIAYDTAKELNDMGRFIKLGTREFKESAAQVIVSTIFKAIQEWKDLHDK